MAGAKKEWVEVGAIYRSNLKDTVWIAAREQTDLNELLNAAGLARCRQHVRETWPYSEFRFVKEDEDTYLVMAPVDG